MFEYPEYNRSNAENFFNPKLVQLIAARDIKILKLYNNHIDSFTNVCGKSYSTQTCLLLY